MIKHITIPFEKSDIQDSGTFTGYGSTFGGKPDSYGDIIAPGAFSESIAKNGRGGMGIAMLYQHDHSQPIGIWKTVAQDSKGLIMEGQLALKTQRGAETYELMKMGALKGLSIGFDMPRDPTTGKIADDAIEINEKRRTQLLKRINLWEVSPVTFVKRINLWEVSPVTFAANTRARVTGVKSFEDAKTVREMEKLLRESGHSKSEAVYLASLFKSGLRESGTDKEEEILKALNNVVSDLKSNNTSAILDNLNFINNSLKEFKNA
jgi:HK97 family phage prohead protease